MKFEDITEDLKQKAESIYWDRTLSWDGRMTKLMVLFDNVSERTVRRWCVNLGFKNKPEPINNEQIEQAKEKEHDVTKKRFLITAAQNNTSINTGFWKNLKAYAKFLDAEILVIPYRYHNPTTLEKEDKDEWWSTEIIPYLTLNRHKLNKNITVLGDVKIQPTASMPLNSLENICEESCVVGHGRVHMKSLPTFDDKPKLMFTTGNLTKPNFSDSKIGKIGEFHLTYGCVIVELEDDEIFYIRQITAKNNGSFNDLYFHIDNEKVVRNDSITALIKGDIHFPFYDKDVYEKSFNELIPKVNPKEIFLHDIIDFRSINHHEANNFVKVYQNKIKGYGNLNKEINDLCDFIKNIKEYNLVVVNSNHDKFLEKFITDRDVKKIDPDNMLEYLKYAQLMIEGESDKSLISYIINDKFPNIKFLKENETCRRNGIELSVHGSIGLKGTKGNPKSYKSLNIKMITAHGHNVVRMDGLVQTGCNCNLDMGYNHKPSDWVHADVLLHNDGKMQHILYIGKNKEFTTLK